MSGTDKTSTHAGEPVEGSRILDRNVVAESKVAASSDGKHIDDYSMVDKSNRPGAKPTDVNAKAIVEVNTSPRLMVPQETKPCLASTISQAAEACYMETTTIQGAATTHDFPPHKEEGSDEWELVWEELAHTFQFYNRITNVTKQVDVRVADPFSKSKISAPLLAATSTDTDASADCFDQDHTLTPRPSQDQLDDVLEAALNAGYKQVIPQLLAYNMNWNTRLFYPDPQAPSTWTTPRPQTALDWAIEHEDAELTKFLLENGAKETVTWSLRGRPIMQAMAKRNSKVLEVLVQYADRVASTAALGLAVKIQDTAIVKLLLNNNVCCEFEMSDRPAPHTGGDCVFEDISQPGEFLPPLVQAIFIGNIHLAKLLLAKGADANVGYHDLDKSDDSTMWLRKNFSMNCGRAIQLAMEFRQKEMVELLLASGADISLAQPVWECHDCPLVPRKDYLRITAGLREIVAERAQAV